MNENTEEQENDPGNVEGVEMLPFQSAPPSPKQLAVQERKIGRDLAQVQGLDEQPSALTVLGLSAADIQSLDTDKLEKLLAMKERMEDRDAEKEFNRALTQFQAEMPGIHKGRDVQGRYQYAAFEDIWKDAKPILAKHGFAISFTQREDADNLTVYCQARHTGGGFKNTEFTIPKLAPIKSNAGRDVTNKAQALGSTNSYAKRYCFCNAFNIVVTDEDDDAQAAGVETVTDAQADTLRELLDQLSEGAQKRFKALYQVDTPEEIPAASFDKACKQIAATRKKEQAAEEGGAA